MYLGTCSSKPNPNSHLYGVFTYKYLIEASFGRKTNTTKQQLSGHRCGNCALSGRKWKLTPRLEVR